MTISAQVLFTFLILKKKEILTIFVMMFQDEDKAAADVVSQHEAANKADSEEVFY